MRLKHDQKVTNFKNLILDNGLEIQYFINVVYVILLSLFGFIAFLKMMRYILPALGIREIGRWGNREIGSSYS